MSQQNPFDQFDTIPVQGGPVYGAPPKPEKPEQPKTSYRPLTPQEVQARGLDPRGTYQISSEGKIDPVSSPKDNKPTEFQSKSAGFLLRALQANDGYEAQRIGARSYVGQKMDQWAPDVLNNLPESVGNSPRRQVADSTQDDFIAATLRYESGAAIPPAEMEAQRRRYFPMPGDSEEAIRAKAQLRATAIEGLKAAAGPEADGAYQKFQGMPHIGQASDASSIFGGNDQGLTGTVTDDRPAGMVVRVTDDGTNGPSGSGGGGPTPPDQSGITGINTLLRQGVTLGLNDEAAGIGGAIGAFLTGGDPNKAYYTERDWQRAKVEAARRAWPNAGNAFEFLGGLGGAGASAIGAAAPTARQIIGGGAALGGIAGFGEGQGAGDSIARGAVGAGANALLGYGLVRATPLVERAVSAVRRPAPQIDAAVVEAGSRQNIPVRQPDANPTLRGRYAQAESSQTGGPMIRSARAADAAAMEQRVSEIGGQGNAADPYALGQTVQNAGERYIARTRQQAGRLYDRARQLSGNATVTARNADAVIDANIQELRAAGENSNAAAISYLEGLRNDIDRGLTIESVQNLRTNMRGQIGQQGLTGTDTERRVSMVIDAMNQDLAEQLPKGAVQALKAADTFYKERQTFINDTLKQFMGSRGNPLPAETAASRLVAMTKGKGNFDRFANMWGQLEPAEQADVAATIAASLGRGRNGEFSPAALVQSLDPQKGINPRTARLVFGEDGAKALNDLRILASAKRDAMDRLSPSGQAISGQVGGLKTLLVGLLGLSQGGPAGAIAGGAAQNILTKWGEQRAARMLLNPDFTRWLRAAPQTTNPKVIDRYFARLGTIASVSANDNAAFAGAVRSAVAGSPGAAAAQDQQNPG